MKKISIPKTTILALLIAVGGWAVFSLVRLSLTRVMEGIGIVDEIYQMGIIVILIVILLAIFGFTFRKTVKKIVG